MKLTYEKNGDYLIPNLTPNSEPEEALTKYGLMRRNYLDVLMEQMAKAEGVDEELKASDQMKWVQMMNNIKNSAEEIVLTELVYSL